MAVTIRDVAREARVSVASVSRALNGHTSVTDETRQRITSIAARLRYVPHSAARSLITKRTQTIGALLPDLYGEFFSELIRGIDLAARARGLHLLVSSSHGDTDEAATALRAMQGRVDGMLILSPHVDAAFLRANLPESTPAVLLNSALKSPQFDVLNIDNYGGAHAMTRHLLDAGHTSVAFISGPEDNFDAQQRERGYREAMTAFAPKAAVKVVKGDFSEDSGYAAGRALAKGGKSPRAVFAANDMMAVGCLRAFTEAGLSVPQDVALAGFDDIPIARYVTPALTTVRVRIADLGRNALERVAIAIEKPNQQRRAAPTLACEVVVRASSGGH
ncbi:MAG: LacI family DNA-binding transcriptional regulator [Rudaea sp.]|uniref:LacI family DNA-binding transcriptional regulator n=1 Tax=unclassified Rudaea TaxID=2627037 RepID=UPI0010F8F24C|nr:MULTISPECIES: LacI family DNA-binding transcriptional regulator [unclassified Rudaea]MBN8885577.1 LacI family DNA-binding transcriptional regulator [Rudaea sp.]MBR0347102.1 LacI family DNA-binding transcriptional regulator [Rudaea sp.]